MALIGGGGTTGEKGLQARSHTSRKHTKILTCTEQKTFIAFELYDSLFVHLLSCKHGASIIFRNFGITPTRVSTLLQLLTQEW